MNVTSVSTLGKYLATGAGGQPRITVDGDACAKPQNLIPVGTAYEDVLNAAGIKGRRGSAGQGVAGGAMMGPAVENLSYPTTKTTSGLIMLSSHCTAPAGQPCIRCGRCVSTAPWVWARGVNQAYAARDVQELGKAAC